jgi:hypothetical protein
MAEQLDRTLYVNNLLDRVQALEQRLAELERLAGRPGTGPGQLAYYQADGSLFTRPVVATYVTDAGQSFSHGVEATINFEDQVIDTHGAVTPGASWVFTAPLSGYYAVSAAVLLNTSTAWAKAEVARLKIVAAGVQVYSISTGWDSSAAAHYVPVLCDWIGYIEAGQTIDARLFQNSGGAQTLYTTATFNRITIFRIH